jgi:hypothetical protein
MVLELIKLLNKNKNNLQLLYNNQDKKCIDCDLPMLIHSGNYYMCEVCGKVIDDLIYDNYIDPEDIRVKQPYKQFNYFKYKLIKLQGTELEKIPEWVIETLKNQQYDTIQELHVLMKQLKMNKYFKNIISIDAHVKGTPCHYLGNDLFNNVLDNFRTIQISYYKLIDKNRQLFNYNYLLFKIMCMYGRYDIAKNVIFISKNKTTIKRYDEIFRFICIDNDWVFETIDKQMKIIKELNI